MLQQFGLGRIATVAAERAALALEGATMMERHVSRTDLTRASDDLEWWFGSVDASLGIRGNGWDPDQMGGVWDDVRCDKAHELRNTTQRRRDVRRLVAIDRGLSRMSAEDVHVLEVGLSPRNWPWQSDKHSVNVRAAMQAKAWSQTSKQDDGSIVINPYRNVTVLGLVLLGDPLRDLYARRFKRRDAATRTPTSIELLRFVESEAAAGSGTLTKLRDSAEMVLDAAVKIYCDIARTVRAEMKAEKDLKVSAVVARHRAMWAVAA